MTITQAEHVHARLAELGPFVGHDPLPPNGVADGWRPCAELLRSAAWIEQLVERTRLGLALGGSVAEVDVEDRVAASTAHLGVLARLVSPAVALTTLTRHAPDLGAHLWFRFDKHRLQARLDYAGLVDDAAWARADDSMTGPLVRALLLPFGDLLAGTTGLTPVIVLGNTASALRGAVTVLRGASPAVGSVAEQLVGDLLTVSELSGSWVVAPDGPAGQIRWRRQSCCLFYRIPGAGLCGDCVLTRVPRR